MTTDLGFDSAGLLTAQIEAPYDDAARRLQFFNGLAGDLEAVPGVTAVAFTSHVPIRDPFGDPPVWAEGRPPADSSQERTANMRLVTPGYFRALGMRFVAGRGFDDSDRPDTRPVTVITRETARTLFPDGQAIGQRIMVATGGDPLPVEVIGIVGDARLNSVASPPSMAMYVSIAQRTPPLLNVMVRTALPPSSLAGTIRTLAAARDPAVPIDVVSTMDSVLGDSVLQPRVTAVTLGVFSGMALLLAVIGLYGVLAFYVAQRRHEIGVRLALGADTPRVLRLVLWRSGLMVVPGLLVGLAAALAGTRFIRGQLYDITPFDPWTYGAVGLLLTVVALAASAWPAWRAAHIDPVRALRAE
jgi:predicted permease